MSIKLENNARSIHLSLEKLSVEEMEEINERVSDFIKKCREAKENEACIIEMTKKLEGALNVRITLKRTSYNRPPKYQYKDKEGNWQTWAGVGKTPKGLKEQITVNGKEDRALLEKFLIDKKDNVMYRFKDQAGEMRTWSGKGRMPRALQLYIDRGYKLDNFIVKKS
ncbi:H-NS family nucleoid-associated regulatory protein [Vibrio caribbeanicus]|uniref:H-NS family nucleoid-associated regulatory protein n=1 Tax=Vibrio caribbeanicus TaxID=701175 RepID=UPI0030DADBF8